MPAIRPRRRLLIGMFVIAALVVSAPPAQATGVDQERVDRFVSERLSANNLPGVAVAITQGDRVVSLRGYGESRAGEPISPRTQFRIGSLSKAFTAAAVLQLVEAGRVDLDAPVRRYLPDFAVDDPRSDQIAVRHLLNHTSGLADAGFPEGALPRPGSLAERVADLSRARLVADPGSEFHYFNLNYSVAARVVEVVSGQPYPQYLTAHLFAPLGMHDTFSTTNSREVGPRAPRLAQGHVLVYGQPIAREEFDGFLGGCCDVVSTAQDLARWLVAQTPSGSEGVLSPASLRLMHVPPDGVDSDYAMGWMRGASSSPPRLEHTGILSTFYAEQTLVDGFGVVLLFNSYHGLTDYHGFSTGLVSLLTDEEPPGQVVSTQTLGLLLAALTLGTLAWRSYALARVPAWASRRLTRPTWRLLPGLTWLVLPTALIAGLPSMVSAFSGRVFTYGQLFWAMPGLVGWLIVSAVTGLALLAARLTSLVRRRRSLPT